jgi:hypothetical protein
MLHLGKNPRITPRRVNSNRLPKINHHPGNNRDLLDGKSLLDSRSLPDNRNPQRRSEFDCSYPRKLSFTFEKSQMLRVTNNFSLTVIELTNISSPPPRQQEPPRQSEGPPRQQELPRQSERPPPCQTFNPPPRQPFSNPYHNQPPPTNHPHYDPHTER